MKRPIARPTFSADNPDETVRLPRAFAPAKVEIAEAQFEPSVDEAIATPLPGRMGWIGRTAWTAGGILVSAGLGLAADRLIRDLFAANDWLGWVGLGVLGLFLIAVFALVARRQQ